ncbi:MAG: TetR family transcriptional regulator [Myxococcales bacterium]|nr:TetR family transcriptional regulator [Myxococcales bacterium]
MLISDEKQPPPATDGRVRRSERSRAAIVHALFELIGEGVTAPTADEVADRASIGIRTVFRQFKDMDTLFGALDVLLYERFEPLFLVPVPDGSIDERIDEFVARRTKGYEGIAPYKRAANIKRARSEFLQERHETLVRRMSKDLRRWFPELKNMNAPTAHALELVTSFEAWDRLRIDQRLGKQRASEAMKQAMSALLE